MLCGSERFSVKEPFVELLKSSLQTFLNAMTFPDKTLYPISSRNDKDFINLATVYLDAVFRPSMLTNKSIFLQEGWRRELDEDGKLSYHGVVFNEMKGAYSSPDELGEELITEMLYGDSCYGYDSGGCPEKIPSLTYEDFVASHQKFYHPSNAYFFLDGNVKLDAAMSLIDSYISGYEKIDASFEIEDTWANEAREGEVEYEISSEESEENKTRMVLAFLATRFDESMEKLALEVLFDAISAGNESPLQKTVLDSGLCEKMNLSVNSSRKRNDITLEFCNVRDGGEDELLKLFYETLADIAERGVNRDHLEASMNRFEFNMRERDLGGIPIGIAFNISVFDTWLYGGDPSLALEFSRDFENLRAKMAGDYFESLIKKYVLENEKRAKLVMRPSSTLGERRKAAEEQALLLEAEALCAAEVEKIKRECEALSLWQDSPDSPEALATLPELEISDIPSEVDAVPTEISENGSIIRHDMKLNGISYTELFCDASDVREDELYALPLLSAMLKSSGTGELDAFSFENLMKRELGSVSLASLAMKNGDEARVYIKLGASLLDAKKASFLEILKKLLYETELADKSALSNIVRQTKMMLSTGFSSSGNGYGTRRVLAYGDALYALREKLSGYEFYAKIKAIEANLDVEIDALIEKIKELRDKIFTKERLTLSISGERDEEFEQRIFKALKEGGKRPSPSCVMPLGERSEGIAIPTRVGFGVLGARLSKLGKRVTGAMLVAENILNYEYLWCEVRVKGGAYGVSLRVSNDGSVSYSSYRDPTPEASVGVFKGAPKFLREFLSSGIDLKKYVIGAMGELEPFLSSSLKASVATTRYLSGLTDEMHSRLRSEILAADERAILEVADVFESLNETALELLIAPKEKIEAETVLYI